MKTGREEFVAHSSNVNCLALGHKSGRVLVTGGDDKKVNLWAVGKPNCIMSLSGHTTAVECVRFGHTEELVCAGSSSGAIKIWDLEAARLVRTLTGHKSNIRCIDFHPYGDFLASGSFDTNIKLWDIRRKGCIFTYKGHSQMVNSLKFSPDGQWIASAGEDGGVKLWDLRAGKMLTELTHHTGPVVDVEFHPHEFLVASGGFDRIVNFWDLENFQLVTSTDGECGPIRCIAFGGDGDCVFAGCHDLLKVYGWEPFRSFDTVSMGWGKIHDIAVAQTQLERRPSLLEESLIRSACLAMIGAAFHSSNVSIYMVDLKKVQPFGRPQMQETAPAFRHGQHVRKSFIKEKPPDGNGNDMAVRVEDSSDTNVNTDPEDDTLSVVDVKDVNDYTTIFRPRQRTCEWSERDDGRRLGQDRAVHREAVYHSTPDIRPDSVPIPTEPYR
ncbi:katanin p80 WD40 repeat-containing subunit B1-like [Pollicipes pollicipes]|uniref:katanin p80 WD40 repeat-containing subunit B1-like n=1 Tax=Pollicipes pollicipes TaxID=41117 RepID=UPI001884ABED|nr:katanin p80 WD40 repeat-containing subunit B1-like [Pollicipes pollicipes]